MSNKLTRDQLLSLEDYAAQRNVIRAKVMKHKQKRQIGLGENIRLSFEDRTTIRYQIQEMLRIERIFETAGIQEELDTYNPLIPDGDNWKVTLMIEYPDVEERQKRLQELVGIENRIWIQIGGCDKIYPIADEDLERSTDTKTSSVHFLRYQLAPPMLAAALNEETINIGCDHPHYYQQVLLSNEQRQSIVADLDSVELH